MPVDNAMCKLLNIKYLDLFIRAETPFLGVFEGAGEPAALRK